MRRKIFNRLGALLTAMLTLLSVVTLPIGADGTQSEQKKEHKFIYDIDFEDVEPIGGNLFDSVFESGAAIISMESDTWYYVSIFNCTDLFLTGYPDGNQTKLDPVDQEFVFYTGSADEKWKLTAQFQEAAISSGSIAVTVRKIKPIDSLPKQKIEHEIVYGIQNVELIGSNLFDQLLESSDMTTSMEPDTWYYVSIDNYTDLYLTGYPDGNKTKLDPVVGEFAFYTGSADEKWKLTANFPSELFQDGSIAGTIQKIKSFDFDYNLLFTSFEEDHKNLFPQIDLSKYDKATGDFIELISIYEDIEIADDYTWDGHVYLYLFNGTGKAIRGGTLTAPNDDGGVSHFGLTPLTGWTSSSADKRFVKFEVMGHWGHRYLKNADGTPNIHNRKREITDLIFNFTDGTSRTYPYNGSFSIEDKTENDKVTGASVTGKFESKINLDIDYTYYRTDTSPEGNYHHNQVDSIYFNVPNYLKEAYGRLVDVKMSYQRARMKPAIAVDNKTLYNELLQCLFQDPNEISGAPPLWDANPKSTGGDSRIYEIAYNRTFGGHYSCNREIDRIRLLFQIENATAGIREEESAVKSEDITDWLYTYTKKFPDIVFLQGANGDISSYFFSEYDDVTVVNVASLDLKAASYKENHGFFSQWAEYGFNYAIGGTSTDVGLDLKDKIVAIEKIWQLIGGSDKLYYAECDEAKLQESFRKSELTDSTMYLVRFNVSDYYMCPLASIVDKKTETVGYAFEEDVYLNLHVLELTYENKLGVRTVVPVGSNHIDAVADGTQEKTAEDLNKQAGDELAGKIGGLFDGILDKFKQIGKILALILGIVVLVLIVVFVVPVVFPIFKAIFGAIGRFFRGIGDRVKSTSEKRKQRKNNRK